MTRQQANTVNMLQAGFDKVANSQVVLNGGIALVILSLIADPAKRNYFEVTPSGDIVTVKQEFKG